MNERFIIAAHKGDEQLEDNTKPEVEEASKLLEIDRDITIWIITALGIERYDIWGEEYRVIYRFKAHEVEDVLDKILSNKPLFVDFRKLVSAWNGWKDTIALWKAIKRKRALENNKQV